MEIYRKSPININIFSMYYLICKLAHCKLMKCECLYQNKFVWFVLKNLNEKCTNLSRKEYHTEKTHIVWEGNLDIILLNFPQLISSLNQAIFFPACYPRNKITSLEIRVIRNQNFGHTKTFNDLLTRFILL